ncbi:MAG: cytochrome c oxidase subunit II [Gammaproteobacteria bacterium]|nr:cytochrome c oxidase subunit II [Gammaproteobacteria bacterium]
MLKRLNAIKQIIISTLLMMLTGTVSAAETAPDPWQLNMYQGVTPISKDIYSLHMIAMWVCAGIGVVVFGVMIYALIHHRKSRGYTPASFHDNTRLEIIWSVIPFIILVALAIPATRVLIDLEDSSEADVTIKVVGYQWKWQYQYLDQGISYFSVLSTPYAQIQNKEAKNPWYLLEVDKPLVVPINKKIRFLVTSNDVIHSWWVPELGVKRDAIPGFMHEAWARIEKPGIYRGQCAELCGVNHAFMPIEVHAVTDEIFDKWVKTQSKSALELTEKSLNLIQPEQSVLTRETLMTEGKKKYDILCSACHQADGTGIPPLYPALKGSSVAVGHPISRHIDIILNGVPGTAMQPYRMQLTNEDIAAIATYERNAWGNNTDENVQPADVAKVRQELEQPATQVKKAQAGGLQ